MLRIPSGQAGTSKSDLLDPLHFALESTAVKPLLAGDVSLHIGVPALREVDNHPNLAGRLAACIAGLDKLEVLVGFTGLQVLFWSVRSPPLFLDQGNGAVTEWVSRL